MTKQAPRILVQTVAISDISLLHANADLEQVYRREALRNLALALDKVVKVEEHPGPGGVTIREYSIVVMVDEEEQADG